MSKFITLSAINQTNVLTNTGDYCWEYHVILTKDEKDMNNETGAQGQPAL